MSERLELTGMVLIAAPIGEYDKRIVLLTKERGKISGFARGARRQNSPLMAACKPFSFGIFECCEGRTSYTICQAQISNYFEKLSLDFEGAYYGMYFLEIADYYARENSDEKELLQLLYISLRALENPKLDKRLVRCVFELRAMVTGGEYPQVFACVRCGGTERLSGYSHEKAGTVCQSCMGIRDMAVQDSTVFTMQYIISTPLAKLYTFAVSEQVLEELSKILDRFRKTYMDRNFKTLEILESLKI